jgi:hypothetical protein
MKHEVLKTGSSVNAAVMRRRKSLQDVRAPSGEVEDVSLLADALAGLDVRAGRGGESVSAFWAVSSL